MRIGLITPYYNEYPNVMAGAIKLAEALAQANYQVRVLTTRTYQAAQQETINDVVITRLAAWFIPEPANYVFTRGLIRTLWQWRNTIDIFIINKYMWPTSWSIVFLKLLGKKVIVSLDSFQGYDWWTRSKFVNACLWLYARTVARIILKLADRVILYHEGMEERAKKLGLRYQTIHNGIYPEIFQSAQPATDIQKPNHINITFVGRLDKIKGYDDLIAVAEKLVMVYNNVCFVLVGSSTNSAKLIHSPHPNILLTGRRKDIPNILRASDIFVLPSYAEGLPNVVMEAMAAGVACVVSNVGGSRYLIQHNQTGLIFSPGDRSMLEHHLQQLIEQPNERQRLGQAGLSKIKQEYNWHTIVQHYEKLFQSL